MALREARLTNAIHSGRCHSLRNALKPKTKIMKKNNLYYFKKGVILSIPITVFVIVLDLFDIGLSDISAIIKTFTKGLFVGIITGAILGIINIFAKVETFMKKG